MREWRSRKDITYLEEVRKKERERAMQNRKKQKDEYTLLLSSLSEDEREVMENDRRRAETARKREQRARKNAKAGKIFI